MPVLTLLLAPGPVLGAAAADESPLSRELAALRERRGPLGPAPLVLLSGPLALSGRRTEHERAAAALTQAAAGLGVPRAHLVSVPGPGDVNEQACQAYFAACAADERPPVPPYWPKLASYAALTVALYPEPGQLREERPFGVHAFPAQRVVVVALNSLLAYSHRSEDQHGWLGAEQLRAAATALRYYQELGWLRVALCHHDPRHAEGPGGLQDQRDFLTLLRPALNLLVHGQAGPTVLSQWDGLPVIGPLQTAPAALQVLTIDAERVQATSVAGESAAAVRFVQAQAAFALPALAEAQAQEAQAAALTEYRAHVDARDRRVALLDLALGGEDRDLLGGLDLLGIFIPPLLRAEAIAAPRPLLRLQDILNQQTFALVLGTPGSGKTALTRWLALQLCATGAARVGLDASWVPLRVDLRRFAERRGVRGRLYGFLDYLDEEHQAQGLALRGPLLRALDQAGRLLWLFDGLDEVPEPERLRCGLEIAALARAGARGLLTSRIVGVGQSLAVLAQANVAVYRLQDFGAQQIDDFVERWHTLAFPGRAEIAARRRQRLEHALAESASLRALAGSPLLLTLLALLNRGGALPRARHRLYERAVELCVQQWEANKHLGQEHEPLDLRDKLHLLRRVAWYMMAELPGGTGNLIQAQALQRITVAFCEERLGEVGAAAEARAAALVRGLQERNELLTSVGGDALGFLHRAFLEHLAAQEALAHYRGHRWDQERLAAVFVERWLDRDWQETLVLLCGALAEDSPETVMALLQAVLREVPVFHPGLEDAGMLKVWTAFTINCLAEDVPLTQEPLRGFCVKLMELVEVLTLKEGPSGMAVVTAALQAALRRFGPRWPQPERWPALAVEWRDRARGQELLSPAQQRRASLATLAIYACEPEQRVALLKILLEGEREELLVCYLLITAQELGRWTAAEVEALLVHFVEQDELLFVVLCSTLLFDFESGAIGEIRDRMQRLLTNAEPRQRLRFAKALELIPAGAEQTPPLLDSLCSDESARGWLTLTQATGRQWQELWNRLFSSDADERQRAAIIAVKGSLEGMLHRRWLQAAAEGVEVRGMGFLGIYGGHWLAEHLARQDEETLLLCARLLLGEFHDVLKEREEQILEATLLSTSEPVRELAELWQKRTQLKPADWIPTFMALVAPLLPSYLWGIISLISDAFLPEPTDPGLTQLNTLVAEEPKLRGPWLRLFFNSLQNNLLPGLRQLSDRETPESLAQATSDFPRYLGLRLPGIMNGLYHLAKSSVNPQLRVLTLLLLYAEELDDSWIDILAQTAPTLTDPLARLWAARALADTALLTQLADDTTDEEVRQQARQALLTLRLARSLSEHGHRRRGVVLLVGQRVGILEELSAGSRFTYDAAWLERPGAWPISPTLPLRPEPYQEPGLMTFFANLLPEGWLLELTCARANLDPRDGFGLLLATGADLAGAVEVHPPEASA